MEKGALAIGLGLGIALFAATKLRVKAADKANFVGIVINDNTELPVGDAVVRLNGNTCVSDNLGGCRIPNLEPGDYQGVVSKSGYNNYYF